MDEYDSKLLLKANEQANIDQFNLNIPNVNIAFQLSSYIRQASFVFCAIQI